MSDWKKHGIPRARMMFLRVARPDVFKALDEETEKRSDQSSSNAKKSAA
ncbi:Uncharacterized protein AC499_3338 [Pseudomonas amygdali pv. lachrymans]|uniref:Uncharacterized protein n=1 Tax=Pseudomonas amygdali pv. lachrymans TaxID=53707 RepID=A0ABR5KYR6_PSEAV|nr:Uncharacterized protein AC499_3338 [Pseudomonas amygdali pv. lachrymans]